MDTLKLYALSFVGLPYKYGGNNPIEGLDCSGLVCEILKSCGVLPFDADFSAQALFDHLEKNGSPNRQDLGSVAFYGKSVTTIVHTAFCLDRWRMVEAGGGDHLTLTRGDAAVRNAFVKVRKIEYRKDFLYCLKPNYGTIGVIS